jgi:receptor protein-tyrosine kinase
MSIIERALGRAKAAGAVETGIEQRMLEPDLRVTERRKPVPRGVPRDVPQVHIDLESLRAGGLMVEPDQERRQSQEFRSIKRALLATLGAAGESRQLNLIGVVSALSGEGKTYVSFNLARSLAAEVDRSVLLVDADLPKRDLTRALGLEGRRGLYEYLKDRSLSLGDVVLATSIPQLYVLPAGAGGGDSAELLASARMRELGDQLGVVDSGTLVVFDSSPILLAPDADSLLSIVGSVVVVIRSMVSRKAEVAEAVARLDESKNTLAILNAFEQKGPLQRYYANYGDYGVEPRKETAGPPA